MTAAAPISGSTGGATPPPGDALSSDDTALAYVSEAMRRWKAQGDQHQSINQESYDKDHHKVLVHIDSRGKISAQRVDSWHAAEKDAKNQDRAIDKVWQKLQADHAAQPNAIVFEKAHVGDDTFMATMGATGLYEAHQTADWDDDKAVTLEEEQLIEQMRNTPAALRRSVTVGISPKKDDRWNVTVNPDLSVSAVQTHKHKTGGGFFDDLFGALGAIAPIVDIASLVVPALAPVAIGLSAANSVDELANGDILGGLAGLVGAAGSAAGGVVGEVAKDATKVIQGGSAAFTAASNGDIVGFISSAASAAGTIDPGVATIAKDIGAGARAVGSIATEAGNGDFLGAIATGAAAAGQIDPALNPVASDIATGAGAAKLVLADVGKGTVQGIVGAIGAGAGAAARIDPGAGQTATDVARIASAAGSVVGAAKQGVIPGVLAAGKAFNVTPSSLLRSVAGR